MKWIRRDKCFLKREDKKKNIFRKCLLKMIDRKPKLLLKKRRKDRRTLRLRKNIPECLRNKNKIDLMNSKPESKELRSS